MEAITDYYCLLGESPVWDILQQRVLWVDVLAGNIYQYYPQENKVVKVYIGHKVGAIALKSSGGIIAAMQDGFGTIDLDHRSVCIIADPEAKLTNNRFNDGKCDPAGRFWAGTMDEVSNSRNAGSLYALDIDLSVSTKITGVSCSNGLVWSLDHQTFYYIDTPTRRIVAYDYEVNSGEISNKRNVINIPSEEGLPDGMTIDSVGMLWVAHWGGWKVARYNPATGERLCQIWLPTSQITSCAFGGQFLDDMYITSARVGLNEVELKKQPLAGALFIIKPFGCKGINAFQFRG